MNRAEANRIARRDKKYRRRHRPVSDNSAQKLALIKRREIELAMSEDQRVQYLIERARVYDETRAPGTPRAGEIRVYR